MCGWSCWKGYAATWRFRKTSPQSYGGFCLGGQEGSLNVTDFQGDLNLMQIYGNVEGFPSSALFGLVTPPKFNIAPEKVSSQKESSLPSIVFQGLC